MESPLFIEIALAVTVVVAVVLIGVLIWIGNEQQRKALDELRTDVRQWALGDLELKRMKAAREIKILDPMGWLDNMVRRVMGVSPRISDIAGVLDRPEAVVTITDNARYLVFSPVHPDQMGRIIQDLDRIQRIRDTSPLIPMRKLGRRRSKVEIYELSALNAGMFFDIEADKVWRMIAKRPLDSNRLWIYDIPGPWEATKSKDRK
jgi:hypothetical protein